MNTSASRIICQPGKKFSKITLDDAIEEDAKMEKFGAVVGNPPYQDINGSGGTNDSAIYPDFVYLSEQLSTLVSLIIPSRWFSAGRKNVLGPFRKHMLTDARIKTLHDYPDGNDIFSNIELKGGVCFFVIDKDHEGECTYYLHNKVTTTIMQRKLDEYDVFIREQVALNILQKITYEMGTLDSKVSSDTPFGIPTNPRTSKKTPFDVQDKKGTEFNVTLFYNDKTTRKQGYVRKRDIIKNIQDIDKPKLIVPKSAWSGNDPNVLGKPIKASANSVCSQTYLYIPFETEKEVSNFEKFYRTRFCRFLVSQLKITQDAMKRVYKLVPLQDFTSNSDIDWTKSIDEIDKQLYKKYGLTKEEIAFIEKNINPME